MNPLAREELCSNCEDKLILEEFFEGKSFLESLGDIPYEQLSNDKKRKVDELLENTDYNTIVMIYLLKDDYYLKKKFKFKMQVMRLIGENINSRVKEHYDLINNYNRILKQIIYLIETKNKRTINEIILAYCLGFLTFIVMVNDMGKDDFDLLNKGRYVDSDFNDFEMVKNNVRAYEISLIQKNRVYKNKQSTAT